MARIPMNPGPWRLAMFLGLFPFHCFAAGLLSFQVGPISAPTTALVTHTEVWQLHRGTNEPAATWQTDPDAALDNTWSSAPGGFGYGDSGIQGERTTLPDMINLYSTLYLRKSFEVPAGLNTNSHLQLMVDYDDGFVAYLDGVELTRANLTNGPGSFVGFNATTGGNSHEASCCDQPVNPATIYDLGPVADRLSPGAHVLALIGVNQAPDSSDFHLITDLSVIAPPANVVNGEILSIALTNLISVSGSNTLPNSTRVIVNGTNADFDPFQGVWSATLSLRPGFNRFVAEALDAEGNVLASRTAMWWRKLPRTQSAALWRRTHFGTIHSGPCS